MNPESYFDSAYPFDDGDCDGALIARVLSGLARGGAWLDLGCGPTLSIWAAFNPKATRIVGADVLPENLAFLKRQIADGEVGEAHERALTHAAWVLGEAAGMDVDAVKHLLFGRIHGITLHDVRHENPEWQGSFALVTQIGCFGCLDNLDEVEQAARHVRSYLQARGRFMSVTWVQGSYDGVAQWNGRVSQGLSIADLEGCYVRSGLCIVERLMGSTRDPAYQAMVVLVAGRDTVQ
jgi:hypothetical protein